MRILLLEDNELLKRAMCRLVSSVQDAECTCVDDLDAVKSALRNAVEQHRPFDAIVADQNIGGERKGIEALAYAKREYPNLIRVLISGGEPAPEAKDLYTTFIAKPFPIAALMSAITDDAARQLVGTG